MYTSRVPSPSTILIPLVLSTSFYTLYTLLAPSFPKEKQRAYILSTISSATMTSLSIPYLYTYTTMGFEGAFERCQQSWMGGLGRMGVLFFGTYLFSDLLIGNVKYPSQVGLLTGWIHHTVYIGLMVHLLNSRLSPVFLIGCIMELPTFDLAISNLFPSCRHDLRFLSSFFIFRIAFHAILLVDCLRPSSRAVMGGSWVPGVSLAMAGLLHVLWFKGGLVGYIKRHSKAKLSSAAASDQACASDEQDSGVDYEARQDSSAEEPVLHQLAEFDPTLIDTIPSSLSSPIPASPRTNATTPETTPLMTPRTPSSGSQTPFNFPALPHLPTVSIPSITLPISISSLSLPLPLPSGLNMNMNSEGFKEAVKSRWEEQRGRFMIRRKKSRVSGEDEQQEQDYEQDWAGVAVDNLEEANIVARKGQTVIIREVELD
ncbi:hypothetical protein I317_00641 [Kwoniella heveanensis CBS 569]|nr:hypothetical protein I317_00641 [Kwoniella heveanensis CBS 569]